MMRIVAWTLGVLVVLAGAAYAVVFYKPSPAPGTPVQAAAIVQGLEHPWAVAFLPDGRALISERPGRLRIATMDGALSAPLSGVPEVFAEGQGGLLDVVLDPDFENNQTIYLSYAEPEGDTAGTAVARAVLHDTALSDVQVIFRQVPKTEGPNHFGSRLAFMPDGLLFITLGERFDAMDEAQSTANHLGAVVRIRPDGSVPEDNPYFGQDGALPGIYSYGHRNAQGAAVHPETGRLWIHEHGPKGGDEINLPVPGGNFGWPEASYGRHYWMTPIPDDHAGQGFIEPVHHWTPSIAPSGMTFYTGDMFPDWRGDLFVGALAGRHLARLRFEGTRLVEQEALLVELGARIRDVVQGPDGALYVLADAEDGALYRLSPATAGR